MTPIYKIISSLYSDESGQGLMEYGLILSLVSIVVIMVLMNIGQTNNNTLTTVSGEMVE